MGASTSVRELSAEMPQFMPTHDAPNRPPWLSILRLVLDGVGTMRGNSALVQFKQNNQSQCFDIYLVIVMACVITLFFCMSCFMCMQTMQTILITRDITRAFVDRRKNRHKIMNHFPH